MKILTFGEIMDAGTSVFHSVAKLDQRVLLLDLEGALRVDNPYEILRPHIADLRSLLPPLRDSVTEVRIDVSKLRFCNSNGFYAIMDIIESLYANTSVPVTVRRLREDDWHQETLPLLLNVEDESIAARTRFEDVADI